MRLLKKAYSKIFRANDDPFVRQLAKVPRHTPGTALLQGKNFQYADSASAVFIYNEIFQSRIYEFQSPHSQPVIVDCGANIGLSVIYFKQLFPNARITAFEPDPVIFEILRNNVREFSLTDVQLINKGLWSNEGTISFHSEGADAGRIKEDGHSSIDVTTLSPYLLGELDLLKIDIEGAEYEVLKSSAHELRNVRNIFVEYHSFSEKEQFLPEILSILKSAGFRVYVTAPGLHSKSPFKHIDTYLGMDLQLNIYGFRS
jgi:FkbM family methyltransferase